MLANALQFFMFTRLNAIIQFRSLPAALLLIAIAAEWSIDSDSSALGAEPARRPNIVVVVADDLGYQDLGVQGCTDCPTPHIDSLAKEGVRCTSGYVSGPYCSPTRAGLMTGRYQQRFGHEFNPGPARTGDNDTKGLDLKQKTLADRLKAAGYATGMVGKWHLGGAPEYHPLQRGFQQFFGFLGGSLTYFPEKIRQGDRVYRGTEPAGETGYLTDAFGREAAAFVEQHRHEPFFLYLTFNAVHTPMEATEKYLSRFPSVSDPRRQTYCAMLSAMDDAVGTLLAKLRSTGLEDDTLIFFISDNGGPTAVNASNNAPLRGNKATTWEGGVRVPFFVRWKGKLPAGATYSQPVIQLDILPTALAAAGSPISSGDGLDGVDLLPYLNGANSAAPHAGLFWRFGPQTAVRVGDWKLTRAPVDGSPRGGRTAEGLPAGLYNLAEDIGEQHDLSARHPEKVAELQAAWDRWNKDNIEPRWGPIVQADKKKGKAKK